MWLCWLFNSCVCWLILHIQHYTMQLDLISIPDISKSPYNMLDSLGEMGYEVGRWNWLTFSYSGGFWCRQYWTFCFKYCSIRWGFPRYSQCYDSVVRHFNNECRIQAQQLKRVWIAVPFWVVRSVICLFLEYATRKVNQNQQRIGTHQSLVCTVAINSVGKNLHTLKKNTEALSLGKRLI